jgi:hypothetical protein
MGSPQAGIRRHANSRDLTPRICMTYGNGGEKGPAGVMTPAGRKMGDQKRKDRPALKTQRSPDPSKR